MVGIGTKTEKYVAASYSVANIDLIDYATR